MYVYYNEVMKTLRIEPIKKPNKMISYWKKEWRVVLCVIITALLFDGSMSIGPILQGKLVDAIVDAAPLDRVIYQAMLFVGTILAIQVVRGLKRFYVRRFANRTSATMRRMLYNNIMNLDFTELSKESTADLMNKAVADVDICVEGMRKVTTEIFDTGVLMSAYLISMLIYDVRLTLIACIFIPVAMGLAEYLKKIIVKYTRQARAQSSKVAETTYEDVQHMMLYRMNGLEGMNLDAYKRELEDLEKKSVKSNILENSMQPIYNAISLLGIAGIFYIGGGKVVQEIWTVGMFSAYLIIFTALATKASKAAKLFNSYQKATVSWKRIKPYLKEYIDTKESNHGENIGNEKMHLLIRNLSFTYPDMLEPILKDLDLEAQEGEIIGVTGPIACGKSTLGKALTGIYSYNGHIYLNEKELSGYEQNDRCQKISYMGHAPELLSDTIYENITLGIEGNIEPVLQDVCFLEDLKKMPEGTKTQVGNGGIRLSGGQQDRIALARALYRKSRILILDDPFSAVDMKTENKIIENLRKNYQDRIIILISHRLAIFPKTDKILLLNEEGRSEIGSHEELMKTSQLYQTIYNLQMGGTLDEK